MSNDARPMLYDFVIAVEKVETSFVRIRDDMRRRWEPIEQRAIAMVRDGSHEGYSTLQDTEFRLGGSWIATEEDRQEGPFQMRPGYCRQCGNETGYVQLDNSADICEACERKESSVPDPGLYAKYLVFKNDGDPLKNLVSDCFVLRPTIDPAAYQAMWQYVDSIANDPDKVTLADDLRAWLRRIADEKREKHALEANAPQKQGELPVSE